MTQVLTNNNIPTLEQILRLQEAMIPISLPLPYPNHYFAKGLYLRELTVPAGMLIVGKMHSKQHFIIVTKGKAEVISTSGRSIVTAGYIAVTEAGTKRVALTLEDTTFVTVHLNETDTHDLEVIEAEHIIPEKLGLGLTNQDKGGAACHLE